MASCNNGAKSLVYITEACDVNKNTYRHQHRERNAPIRPQRVKNFVSLFVLQLVSS